jgi:uncharacterized membrane protein YccC
MPAETPSLRLVADEAARVLAGLSRVLDGLPLLIAEHSPGRVHRRRLRFYVPDWLPALANGGRAFVAIGAVAVFWIVSEWPNGAMAITWTAIGVLLFAPRADEAYARTVGFMVGNVFAAVCAAIAAFALLPQVETFVGFSMVMGLFLIPLGALMAQPWQTAMFTALAANFVPLLAPTNLMTYNTLQFYNTALSIVVGGGVAALSYRLLPPLSPSFRTGRLLAFTLRDLRRLAIGAQRVRENWEGRMYSRLAVLPDQAEPLQRAQLVAALSVGTEIIHLRRILPRLGLDAELCSALADFARPDIAAARTGFAELDQRLASLPDSGLRKALSLRARGRLLSIDDALIQHRDYFDAGAPG